MTNDGNAWMHPMDGTNKEFHHRTARNENAS
jgi:hypothetical protein